MEYIVSIWRSAAKSYVFNHQIDGLVQDCSISTGDSAVLH